MAEKFEINDNRLKKGKFDKIIERDRNFKLGRNGCFDITLIQRGSVSYEVEIYMKLQFFFQDGDKNAKGWADEKAHKWTQSEKNGFLKNWHTHIRTNWSKRNVTTLSDGKPISIVVNITAQQGGWMWDHFEIDVTKIPNTPDSFKQSYVRRQWFDGDVELDSKDMTPKASGQLAAIHEFGHMIGLPDEYQPTSQHYKDKGSIMHAGIVVKNRHFKPLIDWANKQIK